MGQAKTW